MNTPNEHDIDREARLTAYVLGELNETDAAALTAELETDDALRAEVAGLRATIGALEGAFAAEPSPGLTDAQRSAIADGASLADGHAAPVIFTFPRLLAGVGLLAAACLAVVVVLPSALLRSDAPDDTLAILSEKTAETSAGAENDAAVNYRSRSNREEAVAQAAPAIAPPGAGGGGGAAGDVVGGGSAAAGGMDYRERQVPGRGSRRGLVSPADTSVPLADAAAPPPPPRLRAPLSSPRPTPAPAPSRAAPKRSDLPASAASPAGTQAPGVAGDPRERRMPEAEHRVPVPREPGGEGYGHLKDNDFERPLEAPLSTFSVDVDTASYANIRRILSNGQLVPPGAVRIEEMINYFDYDYPPPSGEHPFSVSVETGAAPWAPAHRLVRIGLQGADVDLSMRPATNLVFLLDVSGSMNSPNKLGLVKQSMRMLIEQLTADDRVAIVVYAGAAGLVLDSTWCDDKEAIIGAFENLRAGGSTAGGAGIQLAYDVARRSFIPGGVNRVLLCTDGDFNVGVSGVDGLIRLAEEERTSGVFLSVLGFGSGNFQDEKMEQLSNAGNGNFAYIDSIDEAHKVLVEEMSGTLMTIAKDVKIQVEFNPARVQAYRLIGYANRMLEAKDFRDDKKDAGEIGAGHTVTALYEVIPPDVAMPAGADVPELKYQKPAAGEVVPSDELLTVRLRYKTPDGDEGIEFAQPVVDSGAALDATSADFRFAAAVAGFGMILRDSAYKGSFDYDAALDLAAGALEDHVSDGDVLIDAGRAAPKPPRGTYRLEFLDLVKRAKSLAEAAGGGGEPLPDADALTREKIDGMSREELERYVSRVSEMLIAARRDDANPERIERLRAEFNMLMQRLRDIQ